MVLSIVILSLIVIGIAEAFKRGFKKINTDLIPIMSLAIAIFIGGMAKITGLSDITWLEALVAGLAAGGLWDLGKNPVVNIWSSITSKKTEEK